MHLQFGEIILHETFSILLKCRFMNIGMHIEKYFQPIVVRKKSKGGQLLEFAFCCTAVRLRYLNAIRLDSLNSYSNDKIRKT